MIIITSAGGVVALLLSLIWILEYFTRINVDATEPPFIHAKIPVIGHIIGLIRHKLQYYVKLREQTKHPIYGLNMSGNKIYVVCTPELASAVQRNPVKLSFRTYTTDLAIKASMLSSKAAAILRKDLASDVSGVGFVNVATNNLKSHLNLGSSLDELTSRAAPEVLKILSAIDFKEGIRIDLAKWARRSIIHVGMTALYGSHHPLSDPVDEMTWIELEQGFTSLQLLPLPRLLARKSFQNRNKIVDALHRYIARGTYKEEASRFIKDRYAIFHQYHVPVDDMAKLDIGILLGVNANSGSAFFWLLWIILSRPTLLASLRKEIEAVVRISELKRGKSMTFSLDATDLKSRCPLFMSTALEVLRHYSYGASVRFVVEDTMIGRYLLKEGAMVMIPSPIFHADEANFGPTALELDPYRFIQHRSSKSDTNPAVAKAKLPYGAFRVFGGGISLCPGRHFAMTEVLSLTALAILRFDMHPKSGSWKGPEKDLSNIMTAIPAASSDLLVDVTPRDHWNGGEWQLSASPLTQVFDSSLNV